MSDPVLERFHRALIEEIQTQRPEYLTSAFTVAEIYQNLVPYGSHRDRIGVEMNGDYEDALIRLLAGEGGYLLLDSDAALRRLRAELETQNPNTGLYREYAAVDVRLNQAYLDLSAAALDQLPDLVEELEAEDPVTMAALAPSERTAARGDMGIVPPGVDIFAESAPHSMRPASAPHSGSATPAAATDGTMYDDPPPRAPARPPLAPEFVDVSRGNGADQEADIRTNSTLAARQPDGSCVWCREELPVRDNLNYCPFCGTDLDLTPCGSCAEEIEPGWRFCGACGTAVDAGDDDGAGD